MTDAYADLVFAWGHARIGDHSRVAELIASSRMTLGATKDPVHAWLRDTRIDQATRGAAFETPLQSSYRMRRAGLDAVKRYKIDVLLERLRILDPLQSVDAIANFSNRAQQPMLGALLAVADRGKRADDSRRSSRAWSRPGTRSTPR